MLQNDKYLILYLKSCLKKYNNSIALINASSYAVTYNELFNYCFESNPFNKKEKSISCQLIALFGDKSPGYVKNIYAIIASGNAYLPLDYYSPPDRLFAVLKDSGAQFVLIEKRSAMPLLNCLQEANVVVRKEDFDEEFYQLELQFKNNLVPLDTAYVLYTSGSTGKSKGVVHTHKSAFAFIDWFNKNIPVKKDTVFLSVSPFSFDVSIPDIFCSVFNGGKLFIPKFNEIMNFRLIAGWIEKEKIGFIYSTPTFYNSLLLFGKINNFNLQSVKTIVYAGEQLYGTLTLKMHSFFNAAGQYNLYGPTETNVVTYYPINLIDIEAEKPVPIGKMCNYAECYLKPDGEDLVLLVNSESCMFGYLNEPGNWEMINGKSYYNTGDIVELTKKSELVFKCRKDNLIKRNGYRIELAEINACLQASGWLEEFSVKTERGKNNETMILVYYRAKNEISELVIKNYFLTKLPSYMLPDKFIKVDTISKNSNFKIN